MYLVARSDFVHFYRAPGLRYKHTKLRVLSVVWYRRGHGLLLRATGKTWHPFRAFHNTMGRVGAVAPRRFINCFDHTRIGYGIPSSGANFGTPTKAFKLALLPLRLCPLYSLPFLPSVTRSSFLPRRPALLACCRSAVPSSLTFTLLLLPNLRWHHCVHFRGCCDAYTREAYS